ncbi:MAG: RNA polymerase sigma factor [Phycisphaerae bacterium]
MQERSDERLLADHLAGVPNAFDALVARYADELYGFLFRFVGNSAAADDLVQESFIQVHLAAGSFDPGRRFRPWLYTIAANKARDYLRGRGRRFEHSLEARGPDDEGPAVGQLIEAAETPAGASAAAEETKEAVRALIGAMPDHLRLILVLGYYHQLPYTEIAEILNIPVGTVKSRLHAAVTHFARLWNSQARAGATDT